MAARWLERNYSFKFMDRLCLTTLIKEDSEVSYNADELVKSISFFKIALANDDGDFRYLKKGDPHDFNLPDATGSPKWYWLEEGTGRIIVDPTPDKDYEATLMLRVFTDWPTDLTKENFWLTHADDVLLARTLEQLGPIVRSALLIQTYKPLREEGIRTLLLTDEENKLGDSSHAMKFYVGSA